MYKKCILSLFEFMITYFKISLLLDIVTCCRESNSKEYNQVELLKGNNQDYETVKVYYKRLVMMLLLNANLKV